MKKVTVNSAFIQGAEATPIAVEVIIDRGIPETTIIGMPDVAVLEARQRVRCAIKSAGFAYPHERVIVSLSPNAIRKSGTSFDLAIAAGILAASGQINSDFCKGLMFGELHLNGSIEPYQRGFALYAQLARECGMGVVCAANQGQLCSDYSDVDFRCISNLLDFRTGAFFQLNRLETQPPVSRPTFDDIEGLETLKYQVRQAVEMGKNILLYKTDSNTSRIDNLIAAIPSIFDELTNEEQAQIEGIHSACGEPYYGGRPFRAPHHSISLPGLLGGGKTVYPGEVSLAHGGVLYLDDLQEFSPNTLKSLDSVIADGEVRVVRAEGTYVMPADFLLVMSARSCPCGHYGDPDQHCMCSEYHIMAYQQRIESWAKRFNAMILN